MLVVVVVVTVGVAALEVVVVVLIVVIADVSRVTGVFRKIEGVLRSSEKMNSNFFER